MVKQIVKLWQDNLLTMAKQIAGLWQDKLLNYDKINC